MLEPVGRQGGGDRGCPAEETSYRPSKFKSQKERQEVL